MIDYQYIAGFFDGEGYITTSFPESLRHNGSNKSLTDEEIRFRDDRMLEIKKRRGRQIKTVIGVVMG